MLSLVEVDRGNLGVRLLTISLFKEGAFFKGVLVIIGGSIEKWESKRFEEGLNSKVKLALYKTFGKAIEFKKYLNGVSDAGARL